MNIGASVFLIVVGAILLFAVQAEVQGISLDAVGVILMIGGGIGLLWSLLVWGNAPWRRARRDTVIEERRVDRDVVDPPSDWR